MMIIIQVIVIVIVIMIMMIATTVIIQIMAIIGDTPGVCSPAPADAEPASRG